MRRVESVSELILRELGSIVSREIDSRGGILTFSHIKVSKDLHYADVYFSVIPDELSEDLLGELNKNVFQIQQALNRRLRMRPVPKIRFFVDEEGREAAKIDELLKGI